MQEKNPSAGKLPAEYRIANPEEFVRNLLRFYEESGRALSGLIERSRGVVDGGLMQGSSTPS